MYKENVFLKLITLSPLFLTPILVGVISIFYIQMFTGSFESSLKEIEKGLFNKEKQLLEAKILGLSEIIVYRKSIIKERLTSRVKRRVDEAYAIAQAIYEDNKDKRSVEEIQQLIKIALKTFRWNSGESFIWIVDYDGVFHLSPDYLKHLIGSSIINFKDATGRYVIQEEIKICKEKGEGFIWDTFTKPNSKSNKQYKQVAFVKSFGHYNWYFGSGEYLDTATKEEDKELLMTIGNVDKLSDHYVVVMNTKGDIFMSKSLPDSVGKNIFDSNNEALKKDTARLIDELKSKETFSFGYEMINPETNKSEKKYAFFKKVPNTDWIIGSGFYLSSIEEKLSKKKLDLYDEMYSRFKDIIYLVLIIMFVSLLISYYISKRLRKSFHKYEDEINSKKNELQELNISLEKKVKDRTSELEQLKDDFERLASTDVLTKVHNRYSIMNIFEVEISRSNRYNTPLSVMMLDIDFFKKVNDTFGHDVGDTVLVSLSELISGNLRDTDIVGRYGGEEFLILLPSTRLKDAKHFAERLRQKVDEHLFETVEHITISLGLVELDEDETLDEVFKRVDDLLYMSKGSGRNKVSF